MELLFDKASVAFPASNSEFGDGTPRRHGASATPLKLQRSSARRSSGGPSLPSSGQSRSAAMQPAHLSSRLVADAVTPVRGVPDSAATVRGSWSGALRAGARSAMKAPALIRNESAESSSSSSSSRRLLAAGVSGAEIAAIAASHRELFPDEQVPMSWACGTPLSDCCDGAVKLEALLLRAEPAQKALCRRIAERLHDVPGLLGAFSQMLDIADEKTGSARDSGIVAVPSVSATPERYIGGEYHGLLTPVGKAGLQSGQKSCRVDQVVHRGDVMLTPLCSYEFPALTRALVLLSQAINTRLKLPKDEYTVRMSWCDIFNISREQRTKQLKPFSIGRVVEVEYLRALLVSIRSVCSDLGRAFRINLRMWGDYTVWLLVGLYCACTICLFLIFSTILV